MQQTAIRRCCISTLPAIDRLTQSLAQTTLRSPATSQGFRITTPAIVLRIFNQPRAHRIEINVSRHREQRLPLAFDQHTLEAIHPQRPAPSAPLVEPAAESFLDLFDEQGQIAKAFLDSLQPLLSQHPHTLRSQISQFIAQQPHIGTAVQDAQMLQQLRLTIRPLKALQPRLPVRHLGQQVKMITHQAIGHHLDARELRHTPDHSPQCLLLHVIKEHLPAAGP